MPREKSDRTLRRESVYGAPLLGAGIEEEIKPRAKWPADLRLRIGTSGWAYRHWLGRVYPRSLPSAEMLAFYAQRFATVEVNSTYYRLPTLATVASWRGAVPPGFRITLKAPGAITHEKRLVDVDEELAAFLERADALGPRLGVLLFQLPPGFHADNDVLRDFLDKLPTDRACAIEMRHRSWHSPQTRRLLERFGVARVTHDFGKKATPLTPTAPFVYLRLHGPSGRYRGAYDVETLFSWAEQLAQWQREGYECWCYLNNDERGHGPRNALALREWATLPSTLQSPRRALKATT